MGWPVLFSDVEHDMAGFADQREERCGGCDHEPLFLLTAHTFQRALYSNLDLLAGIARQVYAKSGHEIHGGGRAIAVFIEAAPAVLSAEHGVGHPGEIGGSGGDGCLLSISFGNGNYL